MIIVDTGFWLALSNPRDMHHRACVSALRGVDELLLTTWPVLTETCHLLAQRMSVEAEIAFMRSAAAGAFGIFALTEEHLPRVGELMEKYRDLPMDLADASLVVLAETYDSGEIFSTDQRDFGTYRWKSRHPFRNLLGI